MSTPEEAFSRLLWTALHARLTDYVLTSWRPMEINPPTGMLVIAAVGNSIALALKNHTGEWRSDKGEPMKEPRAWMPAPRPPART